MATLDVQDIPDKLYERICFLASEQKRSLSEQVIALLERVLRDEDCRPSMSEILDRLRRRREAHPLGENVPDSVTLIREDRAR